MKDIVMCFFCKKVFEEIFFSGWSFTPWIRIRTSGTKSTTYADSHHCIRKFLDYFDLKITHCYVLFSYREIPVRAPLSNITTPSSLASYLDAHLTLRTTTEVDSGGGGGGGHKLSPDSGSFTADTDLSQVTKSQGFGAGLFWDSSGSGNLQPGAGSGSWYKRK